MLKVALAIAPSAAVLFLFWYALRALLRADHSERVAHERADAEWERERGAASK